jgi:hypothetical protein
MSLKAKVQELLYYADRSIERDFFNSEFRDVEFYKYDSEEMREFKAAVIAEGISFKHEENYGGEDMGSEYWSVYSFTNGTETVYVKFDGYYQSFAGSTYEEFEFVKPTPVQKIEWHRV